MKIAVEKVRRILVVRSDRFGEFLLNIPVLAALRRVFPQSELTLVINPEVEELASRIPVIDRCLAWSSSLRKTLPAKISFINRIRRGRFDLAVILNPSKEFNIYTFLSHIPIRVGYNRKWGFLLNARIEDRKFEGLKHEVFYNLDILRAIDIDVNSQDIKFPLDIRPDDFPVSLGGRSGIAGSNFIAIHPFSSNKEKEWPLHKFKQAARVLLADFPYKAVLIGGKEEAARAEEFSAGLNIINFVAQTSLIELAAILKKAKLLVTNDSGPMHLAAVLDIPVVAVFRNDSPAVSARRWGPFGTSHIILENQAITNISIDEVLDGARKILQ